jgi:hypothetical protein
MHAAHTAVDSISATLIATLTYLLHRLLLLLVVVAPLLLLSVLLLLLLLLLLLSTRASIICPTGTCMSIITVSGLNT